MIARRLFTACLLLLLFSGCAASSGSTLLVPAPGTHRFPYFDTETPVWSYNGRIPGPLIRAKAGTTLTVEVHNQLAEPTSIHWHGLRIDNAMDGVPGVTQDPIQPGDRFTYRLRLEEAGTYWYHPHLNTGEQLERGLKGVLVVEERRPLPWSQDLVWLLDDWRLQRDGTIFPHFNTHHDLMHDGRWGNVVTVNGQVAPEVVVAPGERVRLRMVNGANARIFAPQIEGLSATVIAVDGRPVSRPFPHGRLPLSPGNRIDLDITIPADAAGSTYRVIDRATRRTTALAEIRVRAAPPVATPVFDPPLAAGFLPAARFADAPVVKTWDLDAIRGGAFGIGWSMNRQLWPDADTLALEIGKPVKIQFVNRSTRLHPMHIHGAFFRVLTVNGESAVEPFTRDTVLVGPRETIVVGLVPEHGGIWMAHCHIQAHADSGMMTTITVE
ncbi:MAG: multicopper oxidase family protein [Desulfosarcinaceae bacterium]|nr:multicopper oxidase family protein [Desulfosarcinaceae bacterium]